MAAPMEKSQRLLTTATPVDRISNLPESVICHILSFLPTTCAVTTSVLSKKWEFLWTKVPAVDFFDPEANHYGNSFVHFVNKVLLLNAAGNLHKFRLRWIHQGSESPGTFVNTWVRTCIARNVQKLELICFEFPFEIQVPSVLFTSGTLENLRLSCCFLIKVPGLVCLPKLQELYLFRVKFVSDECLGKLISGCQVLHSLKVYSDLYHKVYKISSPSLNRLDFDGWFGKLEVDTPALRYLNFTNNGWMDLPARLPACRFDRLIRLDIGGSLCCLGSGFSFMLGRSEELKVLKVSKNFSYTHDHEDSCWKEPKEIPKCLLSSLSEFSFKGLEGRNDEMAIIRYILKNGAVMKTIEVECDPSCQLEAKLKMTQEMLMFRTCPIKFT